MGWRERIEEGRRPAGPGASKRTAAAYHRTYHFTYQCLPFSYQTLPLASNGPLVSEFVPDGVERYTFFTIWYIGGSEAVGI